MIPFIDLATQQKIIYSGLEKRIQQVLIHGRYIMGPEIKELEERLANFAEVRHVITCSSGTDALLMALMAYGVGPGDVVFTSPFTFISTAEVVALLGATPAFVDIDPETYNMDPSQLGDAIKAVEENNPAIYPIPQNIGPRSGAEKLKLTPKGIIPVDIFGLPADYECINAIAQDHGLFVLEDAAQSFGAIYHGKKAGALGNIGATSFFPAKPLGCYGDGGAILTDDDSLAEKVKSIRVHGKGTAKYDNIRIGINGRLDTIQAAILLEKFRLFPEEIKKRNAVAIQYSEGLANAVKTPHVPDGLMSAWAQYSVLSDNRDRLQAVLRKENIPTAIYYPKPLHLQGAFSYLGYNSGNFPVSEETSNKIFSLPMHPYLNKETIDKIIMTITS